MVRAVLAWSVAIVVLTGTITGCFIKPKHGSRMLFLIPTGFEGWVQLETHVPGAPPLPDELVDGEQTFVIRVPPTGHVTTSTRPATGIVHNTYMFVDPDGTRVPLSAAADFPQVTDGRYPEPIHGTLQRSSLATTGSGRPRPTDSFYVGKGPIPQSVPPLP